MKVWKDTELESSILFEASKEKNPHNNEIASKENSNELLALIDRITGNNYVKADKKYDDTERNLD